MATVHGILSVQLQDTQGVKTPHELFVSVVDTSTIAACVTAAQAYFALLDAVTDAAGNFASLRIDFPSTGLKTAPIVKNPLINGALFTFSQGGTRYVYSALVPSFKESLLTGGKTDLTAGANSAYFGWFVAPPGALVPTGKGYQSIAAFLSWKLADRKHRRATTKVSYEPAP